MVFIPKFRPSKSAVLALSALAAIAAVPAARAQDTFDAQIPFSFSSPTLTSPRGIAVAPDGTVYIADPAVGVVRITPTTGLVGGASGAAALIVSTATTLTPSITIAKPTAVAVDSTGALYISDGTDGVVIEMAAPETSSAATPITYSGTKTPTALAVDPNNHLYIADETQGAIYEVIGGTATKLGIALPKPTHGNAPALQPVGLAADASGDVYFANDNDEVYEYNATTVTTAVFQATPPTGDWEFSSNNAKFPIGMGLDPAGNLYVLDSGSGELIENTAATNYQLPLSSSVTPTGLAVSSIGNLYISDDAGNTADEVFYNNNPFNFGSIPAGTNSPAVTVNFFFTSHAKGLATYQSMQGDSTGEFKTKSTLCPGTANTLCSMAFYVDYSAALPGTRNGVVGLTDNAHELLTVPSTGIDLAGAMALYPGTQSTLSQTKQTLYEPQGLAVTGDGGTLFVADEGQVLSGGTATYPNGAVWQYTVTPAGTPGGTPTSLGSFTTPDALALDAHGNLWVADYGGKNGTTPSVTELPLSYSTTNGTAWNSSLTGTPLSLTGSVALSHPMALVFDPSGNLYIGDMGPAGVDATASNPGYIIKVPANGGPAVRLNYKVNGVAIVFPQALAVDSYGNLYIADGGDGITDQGGVDVVPVSTGTPTAISFSSFPPALNQPSGLSFDAANDLYVLDGFNQRVLVLPINYPSGSLPVPDTTDISLLGQGSSGLTSTLVTPSNLVVWPGGQYITIADIGYHPQSGTSNPTQVLTLQSVNATVNASAGPVALTGINVGNEPITFNAALNTNPANFTLTSCGNSGMLAIGTAPSCTPTVTFTGTSAQTGTITLQGSLSSDYSLLGNNIYVSAQPNEPIAGLAAPTVSFSPDITATLSNTGNEPLIISKIQISGNATVAAGGTCSTSTPLAANSTCTIKMTINGIFSTGTVTVTDNSDNNVGSTQTASTYYLFSFGFVTPAVGTGLGGSTLLGSADIPRNLVDTFDSFITSNSPTSSSPSTGKNLSR